MASLEAQLLWNTREEMSCLPRGNTPRKQRSLLRSPLLTPQEVAEHGGLSRSVGIRWMDDQVEWAAVTQSNGREVAHVACHQATDAESLGERHDR